MSGHYHGTTSRTPSHYEWTLPRNYISHPLPRPIAPRVDTTTELHLAPPPTELHLAPPPTMSGHYHGTTSRTPSHDPSHHEWTLPRNYISHPQPRPIAPRVDTTTELHLAPPPTTHRTTSGHYHRTTSCTPPMTHRTTSGHYHGTTSSTPNHDPSHHEWTLPRNYISHPLPRNYISHPLPL